MKHANTVPPKIEHYLAQRLHTSLATVYARISADGALLEGNLGFRRLLNITDDTQPPTMDVRKFFIQPSFTQLASIQAEKRHPIYDGILNIGNLNKYCHSLIATVHRKDDELLITGEYDVAEMERLNAQVIELNEQLAITQRELARSNRKLKENEARLIAMSQTDSLTGIANRRRLMEFLKNEIELYKRYREPFSIIMTDIDYFKQVNDCFGHDAGDEVLQVFAQLMQKSIRSFDLVARVGGEEFIIAMPKTTLEDAVEKASRIRDETEHLYFEKMQRGITASFGVVEILGNDNLNSLLKHADEALYTSKHGGRNRVSAYHTAASGQ